MAARRPAPGSRAARTSTSRAARSASPPWSVDPRRDELRRLARTRGRVEARTLVVLLALAAALALAGGAWWLARASEPGLARLAEPDAGEAQSAAGTAAADVPLEAPSERLPVSASVDRQRGAAGESAEGARSAIPAESSACRVRGVVREAGGAAVAGAEVDLWHGDPYEGEPLARGKSGPDGTFELAYDPPWTPAVPGAPRAVAGDPRRPRERDRVYLAARLVGRAGSAPLWIADAPMPCDLRRDVLVEPGSLLTGRVVDAALAPAAASVALVRHDADRPERVATVRSSAETGRYVLPVAEPGVYSVEATAKAGVARHAARRLAGDAVATEPDLVLATGAGRLAGRVTDPAGEPLKVDLELASRTFLAAPGERAAKVARALGEELAVGKHFARVRSGHEGTFDVDGLLADEAYTVEAVLPATGERVAFGPFPAGVLDARIALEAYRLHVRVAGVERPKGLELLARPENGGETQRGLFWRNGRVTVPVAPGTWHCVLAGRPEVFGEARIEVLPGRYVTEGEIVAGAGGATLVLALGRPSDLHRQWQAELEGYDAATGRLAWRGKAAFGMETALDVAPGEWIVLARGGFEGFHSEGYRPCRRWRVAAVAGVETPLATPLDRTGRLLVDLRGPGEVADPALARWLAELAADGAHDRPVLRERWGARVSLSYEPEPALAVAADAEWSVVKRRRPGEPMRRTPWPHDRFFPGDPPSLVEHPLEPGLWRVKVEARGCATVEREVVIVGGVDRTIVVALEEAR